MKLRVGDRSLCYMLSTLCIVLLMFTGCGRSEPAVAAAAQEASAPGNAEQHKATQENLRKIHAAATAFRKTNQGQWPGLEGRGGLMFPIKGMYPDYVTDPRLLVNPANAKALGKVGDLPVNEKNLPAIWYNGSYWYLGYAVTNEKEGLALVAAIKKMLQEGKAPAGDIKVPKGDGDGGGDTIYRLREGVDRFFVQDINNPAATAVSDARIPVMISPPADGGGEVLFMDGHVQFMHYPGDFPMTPAFITALESLDAMMRTQQASESK